MDSHEPEDAALSKPLALLTGTAKGGRSGPPIGLVDIGVSNRAYLFRVALSGIRRDHCELRCEIGQGGKVVIKGTLEEKGNLAKNSSDVYQMRAKELCPPGPFAISFTLPGPVDPRLCLPSFRPDGILEVMVIKRP